MRRLSFRVWALVLIAALLSCSRCKSDKDRAAEERAEMKEKFESALTLVPYRIFKLMVRARGEPNEPESAKKLWVLLEKTRDVPDEVKTAEDAKKVAAVYLDLVKGMYLARKTLAEHDEDDFPLVLKKWVGGIPPTIPWYDKGAEHLTFAVVWWVVQVADKSQKAPAPEIIYYELSRAEPAPAWPWGLRQATYWLRGAYMATAGFHFAADEELTTYIDSMDSATKQEIDELAVQGRTGAETIESMRATGYFTRAFNRTKMKRDDKATDDVEAGLEALEMIGVENELTWWGWAFVHTKRKRYPEAAAQLDKLANSPHITAKEKKELQEIAADLRANKSFPIYGEAKAMALVVSALIARAGGVEALLTPLIGAEATQQIMEPFLWVAKVKKGMSEVSLDKASDIAADAAEGTKALTQKGLELFKKVALEDAGQ